jgi:hypothetical protein
MQYDTTSTKVKTKKKLNNYFGGRQRGFLWPNYAVVHMMCVKITFFNFYYASLLSYMLHIFISKKDA